MNITAKTEICLVIGDPIEHSLSPQMHNAGYEALGIDNEYVYFAANIKPEKLKESINAIRTLEIRGVSVTIPHKESVVEYLDQIDNTALKIGAVNTIINDHGVLKGYNTDWLGIVRPLEKLTSLKNKRVALIGAGGAARAAAYGLTLKGSELTIYNRTIENAKKLAKEFGADARSFEEISEIKNADIVINSTSVGIFPNLGETPVPKKFITKNQIIFDIVYTPYQTQLLKEAKEQGAQVIHGLEMFLHQGVEQFKLFTGQNAPEEVMQNVLLKELGQKNKNQQIKYCLPIIKSKKEEVLQIIQDNIAYYDYFEVWLDYIDDLNDSFIEKLITDLKDKLILVLRRKDLEKEKMSLEKRLEIISQLEKSESYLDLDIFNQKAEVDYIKKQKLNIKTIISYHNYQETPNDKELNEITEKIRELNPTILKISTFCRNQKDAMRLLN